MLYEVITVSALPVAALSCALVAPSAKAGLAQFETLQGANPDLVFQYKFEGSTDGSRLADAVMGNGVAPTMIDHRHPQAIARMPPSYNFV